MMTSLLGQDSGFRGHRSTGLTLIELLVVMAVILFLMGLLIPAGFRLKENAKKRQATLVSRSIEAAISDYLASYSHWPVSETDGATLRSTELVVSAGNYDAVFHYMMPDSKELGENPRNIRFLNIDDFYRVGDDVADPWGDPYEITFRTNATVFVRHSKE